jgi:hypothetical protein
MSSTRSSKNRGNRSKDKKSGETLENSSNSNSSYENDNTLPPSPPNSGDLTAENDNSLPPLPNSGDLNPPAENDNSLPPLPNSGDLNQPAENVNPLPPLPNSGDLNPPVENDNSLPPLPNSGDTNRPAEEIRGTISFPALFVVLRRISHLGQLSLLLDCSDGTRVKAKADKSCLASLSNVKETDSLEVLEGKQSGGGVITLLRTNVIVNSSKSQRSSSSDDPGKEEEDESSFLKRKRTEFSFEVSKKSGSSVSDPLRLEAKVIAFEDIDFSLYKSIVSPQKSPPLSSPLKLLFLGASLPLSSIEKPSLFRQNLRFLDCKDLSNESGGNKEIRGVVFDLPLIKGLKQGRVYYFQHLVPNVYGDLKQLRLTKVTKISDAAAGREEGKQTSLLKALPLDLIYLEDFPINQRVNVIGIVLQTSVKYRRTKIGCPSGCCIAIIVVRDDGFLLPVDELHSAAVFFNLNLYDWKGLRTLLFDDYSFVSYDDPQATLANEWYNNSKKKQGGGTTGSAQFSFHASKRMESIRELRDLKEKSETPFHFEITACLVEVNLGSIFSKCPHCDHQVISIKEASELCPFCSKDCSWEQIPCSSYVTATFEDNQKDLFDAFLSSSVLDFLPGLTAVSMKEEELTKNLCLESQLSHCFSIFHLILEVTNEKSLTVYDATLFSN